MFPIGPKKPAVGDIKRSQLSLRGWIDNRALNWKCKTTRADAEAAGFPAEEIRRYFGDLPTGFEMKYTDDQPWEDALVNGAVDRIQRKLW